jgi:asparagine synthetase B (glutamine-hydrolysing)
MMVATVSEIKDLLATAVARLDPARLNRRSESDTASLLLSGGLDSLTTGIALSACGKSVQAYFYELQGYPSTERRRVEMVARRLNWPLTIITVPTNNLRADFIRLAVTHGCNRKVHFEVCFPYLYVFPVIAGDELWTGWNADDNYGNTRQIILEQAAMKRAGMSVEERDLRFQERRQEIRRKFFSPESQDTWWVGSRMAERFGKHLRAPYLDEAVHQYFLQFSHDQLAAATKPLIRAAFAEYLEIIDNG